MLCLNPLVIDGDSIRCSNVGEIRLLGVDTPDYRDSPPCAGHYGDHLCDDGAAKAATRALIALKQRSHGESWTVRGYGRDRYGRLLADVHVGAVDI
jgi:endonuclease YncB( thermonuclease family)